MSQKERRAVVIAPPDPCMVMLTFLDSSGRMFMDRAGNEVMSEAMLLPGQAAFLDLPAADVFPKRGGRRVQFRAGLQPDSERGGTAGEMNSCSDLVGTLEVFDNRPDRRWSCTTRRIT